MKYFDDEWRTDAEKPVRKTVFIFYSVQQKPFYMT